MDRLELKSDRLILRLIDFDDMEIIHELNCVPEVDRYNTLGIPDSFEQTVSILTPFIEDNKLADIPRYTFAIIQQTTGRFMGMFGFTLDRAKYKSGEVWYKLFPEFWG